MSKVYILALDKYNFWTRNWTEVVFVRHCKLHERKLALQT